MALAGGDPLLPACISVSALQLSGSTNKITFGAGAGGQNLANSGASWNGAAAYFREVAPGTSGLFGAVVQLSGKVPAMRGTVIAELQVELGTTGGTGALTECVLVQPYDGGERFLARVADVTEVRG